MSVCKAGAPVKKPARLAPLLRGSEHVPEPGRARVCTEAQAGARGTRWGILEHTGVQVTLAQGVSAKPDSVFW